MRSSTLLLLVFASIVIPRSARCAAAKPISAEEARQFGEQVQREFRTNGPAFFVQSIDFRRMLEASLAGQPGKESFKRGFQEGAINGGARKTMIESMKSFDTYTLLNVVMTNKQPQAIFRGIAENGGMNYQIAYLERSASNRIRIVDIYTMTTGEKMSQTFRRLYLMTAADADRGLVSRLVKGDGDFIAHTAEIQRFSQLFRQQKYKEAVKAYESLPESIKSEKAFMVQWVVAAGAVDDRLYLAAIQKFEKKFPNDPSLALISIDGFVLKKQHEKAIQAIRKLDRFIGGDAYLSVLIASQYKEMKDLKQAREYAVKAIDKEPTLSTSYDFLLSIALESEDFNEVARLLTLTEKNLQVDLAEAIADATEYKDFLASPVGKKWMADREEK